MNIATWGKIYSRTALFEGCTAYVCNDHGGIIVSEKTMLTHQYFEKLRNTDLSKFKLGLKMVIMLLSRTVMPV